MYQVLSKDCEWLCTCDFLSFSFLIHLEKFIFLNTFQMHFSSKKKSVFRPSSPVKLIYLSHTDAHLYTFTHLYTDFYIVILFFFFTFKKEHRKAVCCSEAIITQMHCDNIESFVILSQMCPYFSPSWYPCPFGQVLVVWRITSWSQPLCRPLLPAHPSHRSTLKPRPSCGLP